MISLLLDELSGLVGNIFIFFLIPFIWWLIFHRKKQGFFKFIGLTRPRLTKSIWVLIGFVVVYVIYHSLDIHNIIVNLFGDEASIQAAIDESGASQDNAYYGIGFAALLPGLIVNLISNGLCEEALFRGFILRRFKELLGIWPAIIIQGILFGLMHNGLYLLAGISVGFVFHLGMFLSTSIAGIFCGALNEKVFDGKSIIPSVLLHGLNNYWGTIRTAFMI